MGNRAGERSRTLCYSEEEGTVVALAYLGAGCSHVTFERRWTIDPESGWAVWSVFVEATWSPFP